MILLKRLFESSNTFIARLFVVSLLLSAQALDSHASTTGSSQDKKVAAQRAMDIHDEIVRAFADHQAQQKGEQAIDVIVNRGIGILERRGFEKDASRLRAEWTEQFLNGTASLDALDLGDHRPLSRWLVRFYRALQSRLGEEVLTTFHLDDINTMNFAIPVTFHPNGDPHSKESWDSLEYSRHFVPFSGVVTYWLSLEGCRLALQDHPVMSRYCGVVAMVLRRGMEMKIAPKLSDFIYAKATHQSSFTDEFVYNSTDVREEYEAQIENGASI